MNRYIIILFAAAVLIGGCKVETYFSDQSKVFSGLLQGEQEVPSLVTNAHGRVTLEIRQDVDKMYYDVIAGEIVNAKGITLNFGKEGENGPVIVDLYSGFKKTGQFNGTLSEGTFQADALTGPMFGKTIPDLVTEIRRGNVYANIHTDAHPEGEIRAQVH